jgi:hypothetical protein
VKKDRRKFGLRKKKSSKGSAADLTGCSPNKATHNEAELPVSHACLLFCQMYATQVITVFYL